MVNKDPYRMAARGILSALGEELRERRLAKGLTQDALAAKAGLHRNFIGMLERGERNVTVLALEAIAGVLKQPVSELLLGAEKRKKA
ncbi:MAG: helix-turn-helix transcriptional regulator [Steroidobacteraceae bacterium]